MASLLIAKEITITHPYNPHKRGFLLNPKCYYTEVTEIM